MRAASGKFVGVAASAAEGGGALAAAPVASSGGVEKFGWMNKKGKDRWFLLRENVLYWFTKELPPAGDVSKEMRGSLPLEGCTVAFAPAASLFQIISAGEVYNLTCPSPAECQEWVSALEASLKSTTEALESKHSGWLELKRQRRFWFVYDKGELKWYAKEGDRKEKGLLSVGEFEVVTNELPKTFLLVKVRSCERVLSRWGSRYSCRTSFSTSCWRPRLLTRVRGSKRCALRRRR